MKLYEKFTQFERDERKMDSLITIRQILIGLTVAAIFYGILMLFIFAFAPKGAL